MKLVQQSVENLTPRTFDIDSVYKVAEIAGRTAYKSEKNITTDSARLFCEKMKQLRHYAVLEHATIYLLFSKLFVEPNTFARIREFYTYNPFSRIALSSDGGTAYVTTNLRVLVENGRECDLNSLIPYPTEFHVKRYTYKVVTNRQVANEFVRHRVFSFLQESTRYCNYSSDKFDSSLTFIEPWWFRDGEKAEEREETKKYFHLVEELYNDFKGTPQEKAQILPLALKTEMVVTGDKYAWEHFFDLRLRGTTGTPHPQMAELASMIYADMKI